MAEYTDNNQDQALRALAFELKNPLITIARRAELNDPSNFQPIQETAEQALQLIDSYLLNASTEYGQTSLELTPTSVGSVLYDVSAELRSFALRRNVDFVIDDRTQHLVMTHRLALMTVLKSFANTLVGSSDSKQYREVHLKRYKTRGGKLGIGLFTEQKLNQGDLNRAMYLQGKAHMPLSVLSSTANVSLHIADGLCRALGGEMTVKHMGKLSGLATELPRSEQLAFV